MTQKSTYRTIGIPPDWPMTATVCDFYPRTTRCANQQWRPCSHFTEGQHHSPTDKTGRTALFSMNSAPTDRQYRANSWFPTDETMIEGPTDRLTNQLTSYSDRTTLCSDGEQDAPTNKKRSYGLVTDGQYDAPTNNTDRTEALSTDTAPTNRPTSKTQPAVWSPTDSTPTDRPTDDHDRTARSPMDDTTHRPTKLAEGHFHRWIEHSVTESNEPTA